jgi:hypothetical protein
MISLLVSSTGRVFFICVRGRILGGHFLSILCRCECYEPKQQFRCHFNTRVVLHKFRDLLLLDLVQYFNAISRRELGHNFRERMSGNNGSFCVVKMGFWMVCEYVVDLLFEVGDGLAPAAIYRL